MKRRHGWVWRGNDRRADLSSRVVGPVLIIAVLAFSFLPCGLTVDNGDLIVGVSVGEGVVRGWAEGRLPDAMSAADVTWGWGGHNPRWRSTLGVDLTVNDDQIRGGVPAAALAGGTLAVAFVRRRR